MSRTPSYVDTARHALKVLRPQLLADIGVHDLEETAYPVYMNSFPPAAYLGWSRVIHAQRLLLEGGRRSSALDFGSGLGVMLPFLAQTYDQVLAFDLDSRASALLVDHLHLSSVDLEQSLGTAEREFDAVVALDVLEHVEGLDEIYAQLLLRTSAQGRWVISGPSENWAYAWLQVRHLSPNIRRGACQERIRRVHGRASRYAASQVGSVTIRKPCSTVCRGLVRTPVVRRPRVGR